MSTATSRTTVDQARVKVTTWTFEAAGDSTGQHRHEMDYVVVPLTGGTFTVIGQDGTRTPMEQVLGEPYARLAGAVHEVVSTSSAPAVFVEVELKD